MPWLLLLRSPLAWAGLALVLVSGYAAVQHVGWSLEKAAFAQFRADTERLGAEARVKNALQAAQNERNAQEALSDLQTRYAALGARYAVLRSNSNPGGGRVPDLASAAPSLGACPGDAQKPDAAVRRLADLEGRVVEILRAGDTELAKHRELWELGQKR